MFFNDSCLRLNSCFTPLLNLTCASPYSILQMCLVYSNSEFYNTTARIIILMQVHIYTFHSVLPCNQETCNLLIEGARRFLDPSSIFQIEVILLNRQQLTHVFNQVEEGLDKVKISIRNLKEFKTCFQVDFQWSLIYDLYCPGVQDRPAIILHRPRQARTLLGVSGNLSKTLSKSNFPQEPLVFKRYDSFLDRLGTMMEFFSTAVQVDSAFSSH